ncbi:MAG: Gfo/Idh/MocA family oxidoreductase [Thermoguttaceae bacterium]
MREQRGSSRRDFLRGSATAVAGAALAAQWNVARMAHAAGNDRIKVALIGCGGRGNGAVHDCMTADPAVLVVAVADAFEPKAQAAAARLRKQGPAQVDLPDERIFAGLDAYQKAIAAGVDMVILATPPGFRPLMYAAAVAAGKHVFMEKPCCVDAAGYRTLMEANQQAQQKGLRVGVGFQRRHSPDYIETIGKIHEGAIGRLTLLRAYWNGAGIWVRRRQPDMTELQYQVNNWYHFCWLCGDNICEQHIHNLDVCNWVFDKEGDPKKAHPVEANGMGACVRRYAGDNKGVGQIFDEHFVEFTYADGTKMYSQCRHIPNTWGSVSEHAHGTKGDSNCHGVIDGETPWKFAGGGRGVGSMVQEHKDLIQAIRNGQNYCEGWQGASSSMTAVLGRMATYSGQIVRWDDAVAKGKSEFPLWQPQGGYPAKLTWDTPSTVVQDADGNYPIPVPGIYKPW